jgi:peptidoglycan/LPS O-acetylase OafA/YrhL
MQADTKLNNFDLVRLSLSWIVVFVHLYQMTGIWYYSPFYKFLSASFAVKAFFAISGYLVTISYLNCKGLADFAERRIRRIFPAYMTIVLVSFLIGIAFTRWPLDLYFQSVQTWKYLFGNLLFLNFLQPTLPGVFEDHVVTAMNPALWTIKIELCLYLCVPGIVYGFRRFGVWPVAAFLYIFSVVWLLGFRSLGEQNKFLVELSRQFPGQLAFFVSGAALAMAPLKKSHMYIATVISGAAFYFTTGVLKVFVEPAFFALVVLMIATAIPYLGNFGKFGDLSYGTYIFHGVAIHLLLSSGLLKSNPLVGVFATVILVAALAYCSWRWLEKPLLKRTKTKAVVSDGARKKYA